MSRLRLAELPFVGELALARSLLERYAARDAEQERTRAAMLAFLDLHPRDAHLRSTIEGHLTASALVIDEARGRGLLTFHRKLERWLQLGGHCDGDANLPGAALRECVEESGIAGLVIDPEPVDLDIHLIPERKDEPAHLHLDTRFLVYAPHGAKETLSAESHSLGWFDPQGLAAIQTDASVRRLFARAFR